MKINYLIGLSICFSTGCTGNIGIATDKEYNDTYDPVQDNQENNSSYESEQEDSVGTEETDDSNETEEQPQITDFLSRGPYDVTEESRSVNVTNCSGMNYGVYSPSGITNPPIVVLGHGFARGADSMVGWADHLSSWGVEVLLPTLCHYNVFAGVDHEMNGQNMRELALAHGSPEVIYAGHSAGGLAAIIAASQDNLALGVLGLDATDTKDIPGVPDFIGQQYAGNVTCPAYSIMGEQSTCNAENNGLNLFQMMNNSRIVKVTSSDHCDFESPTDWICESQCENSNPEYSDEETRPLITTLGTAAIISLTGLSGDGTIVWTEGLEEWKNTGIIQEIQ